MKKLLYNVYSNITDREFLAIEKQLTTLEYKMSQILFPGNWRIDVHVSKNDALIIDFLKREKGFHGNLGIRFGETESKDEFTFYLTKSFDENKIRYFLGLAIFEHKPLTFFKDDINFFVNKAIEVYNNWTKEDIISLGETVVLG